MVIYDALDELGDLHEIKACCKECAIKLAQESGLDLIEDVLRLGDDPVAVIVGPIPRLRYI